MRLTEQTIIRKGDPSWDILDPLCFLSKNLYNVSLYAMRQEFFKTNRIPTWEGLRASFVKENQPDYRALPAKVAGETVQRVGECMKSFKALKFHEDPKIRETARLPRYLKKESGRYVVTFPKDTISKKVKPLPNGRFEYTICPKGLNLKFQGTVQDPDVIRLVPHGEHITIEVVYTVEEPKEVNNQAEKVIALDFNVSAIAEFSNCAEPRLWNLKPIKSINQYYNKKKAKYQSALPKEEKKTKKEEKTKGGEKLIQKHTSRKIKRLGEKRKQKITWEFHNLSKQMVNHLVSIGADTLVIGKNSKWKQDINLGKVNNQSFACIPFNQLIHMLSYKCRMKGIKVILQEESYTSKASFLDKDPLPIYEEGEKNIVKFSGIRRDRWYKTKDKTKVHADINGAANILRKSQVVPDSFLYQTALERGIEGWQSPHRYKIHANGCCA